MEENKNLFKRKIFPLLIITCAITLTYFPYFKNTFGIDTSTMIKSQGQMLSGYLSQGRFGMVWIFELLIHRYNNQIVPFIIIPLLVGAGIYLYLFAVFNGNVLPIRTFKFDSYQKKSKS